MAEQYPIQNHVAAEQSTVGEDIPHNRVSIGRFAQRLLKWHESSEQNNPPHHASQTAVAIFVTSSLLAGFGAIKPPLDRSVLDLREIARSQRELSRAQAFLSEGEIASATSNKEKLFAAEVIRSGDGGVLREATVQALPDPADTTTLPIGTINIEAIQSIQKINPRIIQDVVQRLLEVHQLTPLAAAALTGNFIQEAKLNANDDHGIGQWFGSRLQGMPANDLIGQIDFAIEEMLRDGDAVRYKVLETLKDPSATMDDIQLAIKHWERYGIKGHREAYGRAIYDYMITAVNQ